MNTRSVSQILAVVAVTALTACGPEMEDATTEVDSVNSAVVALEYDIGTDTDANHNGIVASNNYAIGSYLNSADRFVVEDRRYDGESAGLYWTLKDNGDVVRRGLCVNIGGALSRAKCVKTFGAGKRMVIKVGRCNGSSMNCRNLDNWHNWSGTADGPT